MRVGDPLDTEIAETNVWRMQRMVPVMVAVHAAHAAWFHLRDVEPALEPWRAGIEGTHVVTALVALGLAAAAWSGAAWARAVVPVACAATWLAHGVVIVGYDQLVVASVTPFVGYTLGVPLVLTLPPRQFAPLAAVTLAGYLAAVWTMQPDPVARGASLPIGFSVTLAATALGAFLHATRRRDGEQRATIEAQRQALATMNAALERRVAEQVTQIVARSREVEQLNARLAAQVTARSVELTRALAALARPDRAAGEGRVLGGRYALGRSLGAGGMGQVFEAHDAATGEDVAVKLVLPKSARQLDAMQRLLREARAAATVVHPAVVGVKEVDLTEDGALYVVLDRVDGENLRETVHRLGALPPPVVASVGARLFGGLAAAHAAGVIHRDVKPSNVMVTPAPPGLVLLDFGIAIEGFGAEAPTPHTGDPLTEVGVVLGTPVFVDPAVVAGAPVTPAADVYAAAITTYWCATGVLPRDPRADVRDRFPTFPEALAAWIARCASPDPAARPSAAEAAHAFAGLEDGTPLEVRVATWGAAPTG